MKYIAHRGNTEGITEFENKIEYLKHAYSLGYGLEVDVRCHKDKLYFGHDEPQEEIDNELLILPDVFVHLKDFKSVELLAHRKDLNMFWHNNDEMVFYNNLSDLSEKILIINKDEKLRKKIGRKGKLKYTKYFNSTLVAQFIIEKTLDIKTKKKYLWS